MRGMSEVEKMIFATVYARAYSNESDYYTPEEEATIAVLDLRLEQDGQWSGESFEIMNEVLGGGLKPRVSKGEGNE